MHELAQTLDAMDSMRLLLALLFIAGYAASIGHLASQRGRRLSVALAGLAGIGFVGMTSPWMHGALLVAFAVLAVAVFIALAWGFSAWATRAQPLTQTAAAARPAPTAVPLPQAQQATALRRVRRLRRRFSPL